MFLLVLFVEVAHHCCIFFYPSTVRVAEEETVKICPRTPPAKYVTLLSRIAVSKSQGRLFHIMNNSELDCNPDDFLPPIPPTDC